MRGRKTSSLPVRERYFFECFGCEDTSEGTLNRLFDEIVRCSGMKLILSPQKARVDDGFSVQGIWEASTLAIHGWDDPRFVTVDVYSCRTIDPFSILQAIRQILNPVLITFGTVSPKDMVVISRRQ